MNHRLIEKEMRKLLKKHEVSLALFLYRDETDMHICGFANNRANGRAVELITKIVDKAMLDSKTAIHQTLLQSPVDNN